MSSEGLVNPNVTKPTQVIVGTISEILNSDGTGYPKKIVTLSFNTNESVYIEFRGSAMMNKLSDYCVGQLVAVTVKYDAKTSKSQGVRFNNIYAKKIKAQKITF